jgi:uncharacterized protein (DUF427 family)
VSEVPRWAQEARDAWAWRGQARPAFAQEPGPGQVSVWDFPRPPRLVRDPREVVVRWGAREVVRTRGAVLVLETAHPPTWYLPWADVDRRWLQAAPGSSYCEWKGPARYWSLVDGPEHLDGGAWSYPAPLPGAEVLAECVAFYASPLLCTVNGARVRPQPGGFYGGWITPELVGPFKGDVGSSGW